MSALSRIGGARVLVTGGAGLIGRPTVAHLAELGAEVTVLDLPGTHATLLAAFPDVAVRFLAGDICDPEAVDRAVAGMDAVIHLGGIPGLGFTDHVETYRVNTIGSFVVMSAAARAGVAKIVYASSINANGIPLGTRGTLPARIPYDEDLPADITDWYSLSKLANEDVARMVARRWGTSVTGLRFPLVRDITAEGGRTFGQHLRAAMAADARRQAAEGWSYLHDHDAARSVAAALIRETPPAPGILVAAPLTYLRGTTAAAVAAFLPTVPFGGSTGRAVGLDLSRAREELGFEALTLLDDVAPSELIDIAGTRKES
ncbi:MULTISPECIES: NAD(P)-dependent oxidoreductase [unclassified Cryobacterium]|uniref:NAD-dependent epimerase/dehydratase family protein n=1 Tax=unclassified Cryobacterium TaxID=2649013 RepID=UPI00141B1C4D|nr:MULTISPECIES: NAD(P)-dependent oxidoreductase [unclassified Cryobacterium]